MTDSTQLDPSKESLKLPRYSDKIYSSRELSNCRCCCREASKKASLMTDSTQLDPSKESLKLPAFESTAMVAVTKALELWRDEALQGAQLLLRGLARRLEDEQGLVQQQQQQQQLAWHAVHAKALSSYNSR